MLGADMPQLPAAWLILLAQWAANPLAPDGWLSNRSPSFGSSAGLSQWSGSYNIPHTGETLLITHHLQLEPIPPFGAYSNRSCVYGRPQQHYLVGDDVHASRVTFGQFPSGPSCSRSTQSLSLPFLGASWWWPVSCVVQHRLHSRTSQ